MKRLFKIVALLLSVSLLLTACKNEEKAPEGNDTRSKIIISYDIWTQEREGLPDILLSLPEGYDVMQNVDNIPDIPGEFLDALGIVNADMEPVGYIGYNLFTPYEDEIEPENYYKTVWPGLRLSSMFVWDPFTHVEDLTDTKTDEVIGESGIAKVEYIVNSDDFSGRMPEAPREDTYAVMAYSKTKGVYIGIVFLPDTFTEHEMIEIRKTVEIR